MLSWMYYCTNRGSESFLDNLIKINPTLVSAGGLIVIIVIGVIAGNQLSKMTAAIDEEENG